MKRTATKEREASLPGFEQAKIKNYEKQATKIVEKIKPHKPKLPAPIDPKAIEEQPCSLLELCMWAARRKDIDREALRAFLDMAKEQEREEAETLFEEAMLAVQSEIPPIPRDAYNKHTKGWWARLETVSAMLDPKLHAHGFTLKFGMGEPRIPDYFHMFVDVTWVGKLAAGKKASCTKRWSADIGRDDLGAKGGGTKTGAQGSGSVITYGRRYLKLMICDANVLGMDRDGEPVGRVTVEAKDVKELRRRLNEAGIDEQAVCDFYKVDALDQIEANDLPGLHARIDQKIKISQREEA